MQRCPECNTLNGDGRDSCWKCGRRLAAVIKQCPKCGRQYPLSRLICEDCGEYLIDPDNPNASFRPAPPEEEPQPHPALLLLALIPFFGLDLARRAFWRGETGNASLFYGLSILSTVIFLALLLVLYFFLAA